jgi:outer membrane protein OmpA-like peptidoglycan-associated protein
MFARPLALLAAGALLAGCAAPTLVIVVPNAAGHIGGVVVHSGSEQAVLDKPYSAARASGSTVTSQTLSAADVDRDFADARSAQPLLPASFTLYFEEGSDAFTAQTKAAVDAVFADIKRRPAAEISVIGHTDRVGNRKDNDLLSRQRAERVRRDLIKLGIAPALIRASGRGEREPVVDTADEVVEPRNRRVEVSVR